MKDKKTIIYGVYFVCCKGNYKKIIEEQLASIQKSGLLEKTNELLVFICEFDIEVMKLFKPFKTKIKFIVTKENLYEKFALQNFWYYVNKKKPYYLYYFHTKGVSHSLQETNFHEIRRNLDYFILEKHQICIHWLDRGYDAVGVALCLFPALHFSGNFWWTKSSHLEKLPKEIRPTYYAPEMYICSQPNGKYISICQHTNKRPKSLLMKIPDENILKQSTTIPIYNILDQPLQY